MTRPASRAPRRGGRAGRRAPSSSCKPRVCRGVCDVPCLVASEKCNRSRAPLRAKSNSKPLRQKGAVCGWLFLWARTNHGSPRGRGVASGVRRAADCGPVCPRPRWEKGALAQVPLVLRGRRHRWWHVHDLVRVQCADELAGYGGCLHVPHLPRLLQGHARLVRHRHWLFHRLRGPVDGQPDSKQQGRSHSRPDEVSVEEHRSHRYGRLSARDRPRRRARDQPPPPGVAGGAPAVGRSARSDPAGGGWGRPRED